MRGRGLPGARLGASCLLVAALLAGTGCSVHLHSIRPVPQDLADACGCIAQSGRSHVYVFFVQGVDVLDCANLEGAKEYVQTLGFPRAWFGFCHHVPYFESEMRRIHHHDPKARFALVGFSYGANMVQAMAENANEEGICIDLVVYIDGKFIHTDPEDQPPNVKKVVNVVASGLISNGCDLEGAQNMSVPDVWHFATPTHAGTLRALTYELAVIAGRVPAVDSMPRQPYRIEEPTPHPVAADTDGERDKWDFLKPASVETRPDRPSTLLMPGEAPDQ